MVPIITRCVKKQHIVSVIMLALCATPLHANLWDDFVDGLKSAGNKIDNAFSKAGQEIKKGFNSAIDAVKDRFKDTKTTRAIDYGIRKAALETALGTANGILEGAKQISSGTLIAAEESAKAGLTAAEHFLSDVVRVASPAILKTSAETAKGALEYVKQTGVGVLQGTEWVVNLATTTFDINRIRYQGDLKRLKSGVLGDVLCEGTAFKQQFSFKFDLDPRDMKTIGTSIENLLKEFAKLFNENVANPIKNAFTPLKKQTREVTKILAQPPPATAAAVQAVDAVNKANAFLQDVAKKEQAAAALFNEAVKKLQEIAQKTNTELESLIRQGTTSSSVDSQLAREELFKRLKAKSAK